MAHYVEEAGFAPAQAEANGVTDRPRSLPRALLQDVESPGYAGSRRSTRLSWPRRIRTCRVGSNNPVPPPRGTVTSAESRDGYCVRPRPALYRSLGSSTVAHTGPSTPGHHDHVPVATRAPRLDGRTRTSDFSCPRGALYQLSYTQITQLHTRHCEPSSSSGSGRKPTSTSLGASKITYP
jgi:hypothetical protein